MNKIIKKCKVCQIKHRYCECSLECTKVIDDLILQKCLCYNWNYQKRFDENLKKRFADTYKFSNRDITKFILLLQKVFYPYEYIYDCEKPNETLTEKEDFYSFLNMEDFTDVDYMHAK